MSTESLCFTKEVKCYIPVGPKGPSYEILDTWGLAREGGYLGPHHLQVKHFGSLVSVYSVVGCQSWKNLQCMLYL